LDKLRDLLWDKINDEKLEKKNDAKEPLRYDRGDHPDVASLHCHASFCRPLQRCSSESEKNRTAVAVACGKELQKRCSSVPVRANNMLECLQKDQEGLSARCAALANNVVRMCDRDAVQRCEGVVAGQGNILGCLTTARQSVSAQCNAALDAVFLR
jgi:hypothetical protein